jgi:two-component system chemotaxis response regulator CheB
VACPKVVVIGASAGGLDAVLAVVRGLPDDFRAAVFIVIHTVPGAPGMLPQLIGRACRLSVRVPKGFEAIRPGHIYLPPPDFHLIIRDSQVGTSHGPRQHGFRPAVDLLFAGAARSYRDCAAGIILSGALSDGTAGLHAIKRAGGLAVVQNPEDAAFSSMPLSALKNVEVDAVLPAADIATYLKEAMANEARRTAKERGGSGSEGPGPADAERAMDPRETGLVPPSPGGELIALTCPNCGGALWEVRQNGIEQYECHIGHRYAGEALLALDDERTEGLLWSAVRALKEDAALRRRMAARADQRGLGEFVERWLDDAKSADSRAQQIRDLIEKTAEPLESAAERGRQRRGADVAARKTSRARRTKPLGRRRKR